MNFFGDDDLYESYNIFTLIVTIISTILSLLTVLLIYRINVRSGHLLLLMWMSSFQFIYDAFSFTTNSAIGYYENAISVVFRQFSFAANLIVSNWMSYIAFQVVYYGRLLDAYDYFYVILWTSLIPGLALGIFYGVLTIPRSNRNDDLANYDVAYISSSIRLALILVNLKFALAIMYKISSMSSKAQVMSSKEAAIRTIAVRMVFYPILQIIGRSGRIWYDFAYDGNHDLEYDLDAEKYTCIMYATLTTAFISIGYFLIPLIMQPGAYEHFHDMIRCIPYEVTVSRLKLRDQSLDENTPVHSKQQSSKQSSLMSSSTAMSSTSIISNVKNSKSSNAGSELVAGPQPSTQRASAGLTDDATQSARGSMRSVRSAKFQSLFASIDFANLRASIADSRMDEELSFVLQQSFFTTQSVSLWQNPDFRKTEGGAVPITDVETSAENLDALVAVTNVIHQQHQQRTISSTQGVELHDVEKDQK